MMEGSKPRFGLPGVLPGKLLPDGVTELALQFLEGTAVAECRRLAVPTASEPTGNSVDVHLVHGT